MRLSMRLMTLSLLATIAAPLHRELHAQLGSQVGSPLGARVAPDAVVTPQDTAAVPATISDESARNGGAPLTGLRSGVHQKESTRALQPNAVTATNPHLGQARAMILVGAAALVTGAIVGGEPGTIIMVGGTLIGLYGLYQYLQ